MSILEVQAWKTRVFQRGESLASFILEAIPRERVGEKTILAVTSKIMSLAENRLVSRASAEKASLVKREADVFLGEVAYGCFLTIKEGLFIPSAGIDESNSSAGDFILYPEKPHESSEALRRELCAAWGIRELGILLTDSHTSPLRKGVTGIALAHAGFQAVTNKIGTRDLFGRELQMTKINHADALAAAAVVMMGEGDESQPLALIRGAGCEFCERVDTQELRMPLKEDLYYPFFAEAIERNQ